VNPISGTPFRSAQDTKAHPSTGTSGATEHEEKGESLRSHGRPGLVSGEKGHEKDYRKRGGRKTGKRLVVVLGNVFSRKKSS